MADDNVGGGTAPTAAESFRIHVGGLRESVTVEDMVKTFSSLGRVSRVEFVSRPEGRSFAYMDFEPNSDKSLSRLFATYNGCAWKGGKLKLEKAKEHYMDRLKREWAEAAKVSKIEKNDHPEKKDSQYLSKSKFTTQKNAQLRIFFPRLHKVKMLPFKGTGKHKYSFQNIKIPLLPIHFCDCEEHCKPFAQLSFSDSTTSYKDGDVTDKKEISMMNSVMKKLFDKKSSENLIDEGLLSAIEMVALECCANDSQVSKKKEAIDTDENFVMNIGMGESNAELHFFQAKKWAEGEGNQDAKNKASNELTAEKDNSCKRQKTGSKNLLEVSSKMRSGQPCFEADVGQKEFTSVKPGNKRISKSLIQELHDFSKAPADQQQSHDNPATIQSVGGPSWKQKSSWKELMGDAKNSAFSVSHILPSVQSKQSNARKSLGASSDNENVVFVSDEDYSTHLEVEVLQKERVLETHVHEDKPMRDHAISNKEKLKDFAITNQNEDKPNASVSDENNKNCNNNSHSEFQNATPGNQSISEVRPEELQVSPKTTDEGQLNQNPTNATRGSSWLHKSSWTALVGDTKLGTFSVSQLVPGVDQLKPKLPEPCALVTSGKGFETDDGAPKEEAFYMHSDREKSKKVDVAVNSVENPQDAVEQKSIENGKSNAPAFVIGQVCTFMRNDNSEKQWRKARVAIRGQLNKANK